MSALQDAIQADVSRWLAGCALAVFVAGAGFRSRSLTMSGAVAATATGGLLVGAGGWWSGFLLVAFFVSSSALSHANRAPGMPGTVVRQARGHRRDAVQVIANGGVPVACALVGLAFDAPMPWLVGAAAAIAGATADTWATELGRTSSSPPRSVVTGKRLPPGTSGAVSAIGTSGAVAGAVLVAALAALGAATGVWLDSPAGSVFLAVAAAGVAGALLDSVLGATVQGIWWCASCDEATETAVHSCGSPTSLVRGLRFLDNDGVNAVSIAVAGLAGMLLMHFAG